VGIFLLGEKGYQPRKRRAKKALRILLCPWIFYFVPEIAKIYCLAYADFLLSANQGKE